MVKQKIIKKNLTWIKVVLTFVLLFFILFFLRLVTPKHLDDVHPSIQCDDQLLEKADIFYIIPKFEGVNISDNLEWCAKILSYNKTLAMHGVYHNYKEFSIDRDKAYVQDGAEEFKKCFGFYPTHFKAPQTVISVKNNELLISIGYKVDSLFGDTFHKVYHCNDQGYYSNWISNIF